MLFVIFSVFNFTACSWIHFPWNELGTITLSAGRKQQQHHILLPMRSFYNHDRQRIYHHTPDGHWAHALICATEFVVVHTTDQSRSKRICLNLLIFSIYMNIYFYRYSSLFAISVCTIYLVHIHWLMSSIYHFSFAQKCRRWIIYLYVDSICVQKVLLALAAVRLNGCGNTNQSSIYTEKQYNTIMSSIVF